MLELSRITAFPLRFVCVPFGFPQESAFPLFICIMVESMTSPIVITKGENAFIHTNEVSSYLGKNAFLHTNKRHSRTIKTIHLPKLAR